MPHVASTLTNTTKYTNWIRGGDGRLVMGKSVTIGGGFGLANKNFVTQTGASITSVTDEELKFLEADYHFQEHQKAGFVRVYKSAVNGDRALGDMAAGDASQPLSPMSYQEKDDKDPSVMSVHTGPVAA